MKGKAPVILQRQGDPQLSRFVGDKSVLSVRVVASSQGKMSDAVFRAVVEFLAKLVTCFSSSPKMATINF